MTTEKSMMKNFKQSPVGKSIGVFVKSLKHRPFYNGHCKTLQKDLFFSPKTYYPKIVADSIQQRRIHLDETINWLCRGQDANQDGGVAVGYGFRQGWGASYPETTGYIIETFYEYAQLTGDDQYRARALKMAQWLLKVQMENGAYQGFTISDKKGPVVFNTGQIIFGLLKTALETHDEKFLEAAQRAGDWLVNVQDANGAWSRYTYNDFAHAYHARVAWPLLELYKITKKESYKTAAIRNCEWILTLQDSNGWYHQNSFFKTTNPFTHNIVYTTRGIFESGMILNEEHYIASAEKVLKPLMDSFEQKKYLCGEFNEKWESSARYSCLTGNSQLAICLFKFYKLRNKQEYLTAAKKLNRYNMAAQDIVSSNPGIKGGIKGSVPVWGDYMSFFCPNWAAKFFADALMQEVSVSI